METKTFNSKKYGTVTCTHTQEKINSNNCFTTDVAVTKKEAAIIQERMGYHPAGYGFEWPHKGPKAKTWQCRHSCD